MGFYLFLNLTGRVLLKLEHTLVTVQAPPPLLAVALPGLLAGPVEAAGVSGALVAEFSLPALPAHTLPRRLTEAVLLTAPCCTDG